MVGYKRERINIPSFKKTSFLLARRLLLNVLRRISPLRRIALNWVPWWRVCIFWWVPYNFFFSKNQIFLHPDLVWLKKIHTLRRRYPNRRLLLMIVVTHSLIFSVKKIKTITQKRRIKLRCLVMKKSNDVKELGCIGRGIMIKSASASSVEASLKNIKHYQTDS